LPASVDLEKETVITGRIMGCGETVIAPRAPGVYEVDVKIA